MPDRPPFESMTTEQLSEWCSMDANRPGNYPLTLDGADAAMPDGWEWYKTIPWGEFVALNWGGNHKAISTQLKDPVYALFRLAAECRWAERSNP